MKNLDNVQLLDLIPDSIAKDKNVIASSKAIDPQLKAVSDKVDIPSLYVNIDNLSSLALDHLAKQYDITIWRDSWEISLKRSVLKTSISDKRKKGTIGAVKEALRSLGSSASIVEWWQTNPKGTPHTFNIFVTQPGGVVPAETQEDVIGMINDAKPLRSHYNLIIQHGGRGDIGVFGCMRVMTVSIVRSLESASVDIIGGLGMVGVSRSIERRHLIGKA